MKGSILGILLGLCLVMFYPARTSAGVSVSIAAGSGNFNVLANYGDWVNVPAYGQVWQPYVVSSWQPMVHGQWVWTSSGWSWVSYEPFGWVVYHYGYWDYAPAYGWIWIPGNTWSPARVNWLYFGSNVAWAPMTPPGRPVPDLWSSAGLRYWRVVRVNDITVENVSRVIVVAPPRPAKTVVVYRRAPVVTEVEKVTRVKIVPVKYNTETVSSGKATLKKVSYPVAVTERARPHEQTVERDVLVHKQVVQSKPKDKNKDKEKEKEKEKH